MWSQATRVIKTVLLIILNIHVSYFPATQKQDCWFGTYSNLQYDWGEGNSNITKQIPNPLHSRAQHKINTGCHVAAKGAATHLESQPVFLLPEAKVCDLLIPKLIWLHYTHERHLGWDHVLKGYQWCQNETS